MVSTNGWRNLIVLSICLAFSAFYELIELLIGEDADAFLGAQEYIWDTQSDMGLALLGTICCLLIIQKEHDRQIKRLLS